MIKFNSAYSLVQRQQASISYTHNVLSIYMRYGNYTINIVASSVEERQVCGVIRVNTLRSNGPLSSNAHTIVI